MASATSEAIKMRFVFLVVLSTGQVVIGNWFMRGWLMRYFLF